MKLREKTTAILLILLALAMIAPMAVMAPPIQETVEVWWFEDAERFGGNGELLSTWLNCRIPDTDIPDDYIEFAVHGKSYHALEVEWFYNYYPLDDFESSPFVIANGKFSFWASYISPSSGLLIKDRIKGELTICDANDQYTAFGSYVQYSYVFGTAEAVSISYPDAEESPRTQGMWLLGTTYYTVHGQVLTPEP